MNPHHQLTIGPMGFQQVGTAVPTGTNRVEPVTFSAIDVVASLDSARGLHRLDFKELARRMDMDKTTVSKSFSPHEPKFNSFMKRLPKLGPDVLRSWIELMARDMGMTLAARDPHREAMADAAITFVMNALKAMGR
jgi:hypothetical protein